MKRISTIGKGKAGATEVEEACQKGWIEVASASDVPLLRLLKRDLDDGEAEVIALAVERQASPVLLDESDTRRVAELYSLRKTGIIGLLIRAKREGRIQSLRMELEKLQRQRFRIEERLFEQALHVVGER